MEWHAGVRLSVVWARISAASENPCLRSKQREHVCTHAASLRHALITGIGHRVGLFEQPPGFGTPGGSPHGGVASASPTPPGHSPRDAATQSGPASPAIEIRVNSSTSPARPAASPRQQASYGDGGYPPYLPYPPPPSAPPPPQIVVAPTDPAALAGLAALQQLSALSALSGLGQAVGVPPVDDPTLWPDLTEVSDTTVSWARLWLQRETEMQIM